MHDDGLASFFAGSGQNGCVHILWTFMQQENIIMRWAQGVECPALNVVVLWSRNKGVAFQAAPPPLKLWIWVVHSVLCLGWIWVADFALYFWLQQGIYLFCSSFCSAVCLECLHSLLLFLFFFLFGESVLGKVFLSMNFTCRQMFMTMQCCMCLMPHSGYYGSSLPLAAAHSSAEKSPPPRFQ